MGYTPQRLDAPSRARYTQGKRLQSGSLPADDAQRPSDEAER